jgi:hypothetical protein
LETGHEEKGKIEKIPSPAKFSLEPTLAENPMLSGGTIRLDGALRMTAR